jgi:hypothetical protein
MSTIEGSFDVLARKTNAESRELTVLEADSAFSTRGISDRWITVGENGKVNVSDRLRNEKVFAIGSQGAIGFKGKLSHTDGPQRYYAVLYPKGFVEKAGADLRIAGTAGKSLDNPNATLFKSKYAPEGKVFSIRTEKSTRQNGQVHIQFGEEWDNMEINGVRQSQLDFMREHAVGIVEFDADGKVLSVRKF